MRKLSSLFFGAGLCASVLGVSASAEARSRGIVASSCDGCHGASSTAQLSLSPSPASFEPGARVTFTLGITSPSIKVGGTYLSTNVGTLSPISGEELVAGTDALMHDAPKPASGGQVTFRFEWQAPATPGAVTVAVAALAANGDGRTSLDASGYREFQFVFGCEGREYYRDSDRDGYGTADLPTLLACADDPPDQVAPVAGDCDDYNEARHPAAAEMCNGKDDDCNEQIDEGNEAVMLWPDEDGDGYYASQTGTPKVGCAGLKGYAALPGDCAPSNAEIHPGATETCNDRDDNCDGRVDERVRPQCGLYWCRRDSLTCKAEDCRPGEPSPETCNLIDDDCNGVADDGAVCGSGLSCVNGQCMPSGTVGSTGGSATSSGGASNGGAKSGGSGGSGGTLSGATSGSSSPGVANGSTTEGTRAGCGVAGRPAHTSGWPSALALVALVRRSRRRAPRAHGGP